MPDRKHPSRSETIVILGAGYSGTLVATNILRKCQSGNVQIILVENCPTFGRGLAYRTWDDNFLLNVPAGNMSALADAPDHFVDYCRNIDPAFNSSSFISRRIYGDYLEHTLNQAEIEGSLPLHRLHAQALGITPRPENNAFTIELDNGDILQADKVVLALGHFPPRNPAVVHDVAASPRYLANPYDYLAVDRIADDEAILLLGSGHTAVDCAFRLAKSSGSRKIYLVSRRGLLPQTHRPSPKAPIPIPFPAYLATAPLTIRAYIRALRQEAKQRIANNGDWRDVINELRPHTPEIWQRLPLGEKRKFL
ncbi:MAG TPA: FAD/NAD(P)-binding protein, partial [Azospira sp.]|nr:FAD/NAD(P)-binding protein [Azospira sp.]